MAASDLFQRFWQDLALPAGAARPPLSPDEVECIMRDRVSLVDGRTNRVVHQGGLVILTSHRIIWHSRTESRAVHGHLSLVGNARKSFNLFKPSNRVHVFLRGAGDDAATKIDFVQGGRDEFLDQLRHVLQLRDWERSGGVPRAPGGAAAGGGGGGNPGPGGQQQGGANPGGGVPEPVFTTRTAGVGGIIRRQEHTRAAQDRLATEAFADLTTLMGKAREVVGVIERYASVLAAKEGGKEGDEDAAATAELQGLLLDMGIANPVTRVSAGSLYHQELARQLAEFLRRGDPGILRQRGGMVTLHDAFCLFNRARGTALISPEDLLDACKLLEPLQLGMRLRRFQSGVSVIEAEDFSDEKVSAKLAELVAAEQDGSLTALDVAGHMKVSITLAQEYLKTAEAKGRLCRDQSMHGLLFYPNRFPDFAKALDGAEKGEKGAAS